MIYLDEDALICDFAEIYHIYDYAALPPHTAGVLACGLRQNSRIKMKMANQEVDVETMINATIADRLAILVWQNTKDGHEGVNPPQSILQTMLNKKPESDFMVFDTGSDFEEYKERIIHGE